LPLKDSSGPEEVNTDACSFSSTGAAHAQRGSGEQTPAYARIHTYYRPGHIIEVKYDNPTFDNAIMQLMGYVNLAGNQSHDERLRSYLVLGHKYVALEHPDAGDETASLGYRLCELAVRHWNLYDTRETPNRSFTFLERFWRLLLWAFWPFRAFKLFLELFK